jgi:hypothetical protein
MLHYSCDLCKRAIDPHADVRHVVKIEVFAAIDDVQTCGCEDVTEDDADHLESMHDLLERLDDCPELEASRLDDPGLDDSAVDGIAADGRAADEPETRSLRFDLCDDCRRRFLRNPLGVKPGKQFDFSNN